MKVAFFVHEFPKLSETFILNLISGLFERGHEVDIYANRRGDTSKVHSQIVKYDLLNRTYYIPYIPKNYFKRAIKATWLSLKHAHKDPQLWLRSLNVSKYGQKAASLEALYNTIPLLGKQPYDVIHCQFGHLGLLGMELRNLGAIQGKLVTSFRGYDISAYIREHGEDTYNQLFQSGDFFLTNCDFFRHRLIKLGCDQAKVVVHRSGVDCAQFPFSPRLLKPGQPVRLITIGRLVGKKGIEYAIRAVAKLAQDRPNIQYDIIGDGHLKEELEQLIQQLDVGHIVKLLGWRNQEEIIETLENCHIMIASSVTSKEGDQDAPVNVLKEAMAMGLPVIGTLHGGIPELIEDGVSGFLVAERDIDTLAEKLQFLVDRPDLWAQMGQAGRAYVEEHYDLEKLNDQLVETYQRLLA